MESIINLENQVNELDAKLAAKKAELKDLVTMGAVVTSIHEINAVLSVVMEMALGLVKGEVGLIMLEENGELKDKISWGIDESFVKTLMYEDQMDLSLYCFNNLETIRLSEIGLKTDKGLLIESIISVPIRTADKCFGVILIINKSDGNGFSDEDKEILEMLMNFVAVSIDNSMLLKDKLKQQKTEQEMAIAKQVQETILPQDIDMIKGAEIGVAYYPANEVGGDFFDLIKIDDSRFIVIMGDVSNKGVPAALIMSAAAGIIKSLVVADPNITVSELAGTTNRLLANEIIKHREMFVTLFFSKFDIENKILTYCNAGHIPGLFWDDALGKIIELPDGGPIIGQFPDVKFKEGKQKLNRGDRLFLFTDGLTEAADDKDNLFGRERVEQAFISEIGQTPKEFCLKVKEWVDQFTVGCSEESVDDFTIMQVKME